MRYFRRLPPLLRVASILGLLFALASIALLVVLLATSLPSFPQTPPDFGRRVLIGVNLGMLSGACSFAVNSYSIHFHQLDRGPFPLDSWQSQVRAILLLSALPLCGIALALINSPTSPTFVLVNWLAAVILLLAAVMLLVAHFVLLAIIGPASSEPTRTPRAQ